MKIAILKDMQMERKMDLTLSAINGDKEAFSSLIQENKRNLYRVAKGILHHEADVEDAIQMTILRAYENIGKLRVADYFRTWLIRILINECKSMLKKKNRTVYLENMNQEAVSYTDTYENLELQEALYSLKDKLRIVTVLFYYEDLSTKEIARLLSIPDGTVRSRLSKARELLQKKLNENRKEQ
ncbi:sigma-70 family RNA polymerase sigma factor [Terribacillus sp. 179-K 1B1 HS]|uniref:RNA polymerase sigma factor n=1 Tax=Terribacillus sp. 179-K 1B1 HS TaxID=3142388 RepID=UPI0039A31184